MRVRCDRRWEVDASEEGRLGDKEIESLERHLRGCDDCRSRRSENARVRDVARALPRKDEEPSDLVLKRLRGRILRDVATGVLPREGLRPRALVAAAAAALLVVGGAWAALRAPVHPANALGPPVAPIVVGVPVVSAAPGNAEPYAGSVTPLPPAAEVRWEQVRDAGIERVTLNAGTIDVHVRHQGPVERFLVALPDGEIEVRGTTFQVTVTAGRTARVHVDEGLVELRIEGQDDHGARIAAGETWTPPAVGSVAPAGAPSSVAPQAPSAGGVADGSMEEGAAAYASAVQLLRQGRATDAAAGFQAFLLAYPRAAQAEDATFLEAVALARAGRADAAALAAEQHLARFPGSFHRKEAAILVVRSAGLRGDCTRARATLAPWANDAEARSALGACAP